LDIHLNKMIDYKIIDKDIIHTKLPKLIIKELEVWKKECDKIKNHPLSYLKEHDNAGSKTNYYQTSVPTYLIENSYWLAYIIRLSGIVTKEDNRSFFIRKWNGHFDNYDVWINYSYMGNYNPTHSHSGTLSGVIYLQNEDETIFTDNNYRYKGNKGDMLIFPSSTLHKVDVQQKDYERITFAFNINYKE